MRKTLLIFFLFHIFAFSSIRLYIFSSPDCPGCQIINPENIKKIENKLKVEIEPIYYDIREIENYKRLIEMEEKYKDTDNDLPVVFIGDYVLGGREEIEGKLEKVIREYAEKGRIGGSEKVDIVEKEEIYERKKPVYIAFFYDYRCKECERVFYLLKYLKTEYPFIVIREFDLNKKENKIIFEAIAEELKIPERRRLVPGTLIIGKDYLQQNQITLKNIEELLDKYRNGTEKIWLVSEREKEIAEKRIKDRFNSLNILTVCFAGLVDGVNPCAFAVLVFFISYLTVIKKKGKEIILVGFSFMVGVFLIYFLIGVGSFSFLSQFKNHRIFTKVLNISVGTGATILGILSFYDFLKVKRGKIKEIKLQLPKFIKRKIHSTIIKKLSLPGYISGAFISGVIVSFLEFACTGQVYFPTIVFVLNETEIKNPAYFYLFLYNIFFIFPLLFILLISYSGTTSTRISQFFTKHLPQSKLLLSLFFFSIGFYLLFRELFF